MDLKTHKKWKYEDDLCVGCGKNVESEEEFIRCEGYITNKEESSEKYSYSWFCGDSVSKSIMMASMIYKRLKRRTKILEEPG